MAKLEDELMMAFTDQSEPIGLITYINDDLCVRSDGMWIPVGRNNPQFEEFESVPTTHLFLKFYDKLDASGQLPTYEQATSYEKSNDE